MTGIELAGAEFTGGMIGDSLIRYTPISQSGSVDVTIGGVQIVQIVVRVPDM